VNIKTPDGKFESVDVPPGAQRFVRRPMVLVLAQDERGRFYIEAPDLWAVRSFTAELPAPREAARVAEMTPEIERRGLRLPARPGRARMGASLRANG
jgi:hypothetical protein